MRQCNEQKARKGEKDENRSDQWKIISVCPLQSGFCKSNQGNRRQKMVTKQEMLECTLYRSQGDYDGCIWIL